MKPTATRVVNDIIEKKCSYCKEFKVLDDNNFYRHKGSHLGFQPYCKICTSKYYKERNTKEKNRRTTLRKRGINIEIYERLYKNQEGKCAICREFQELLHADHCHIRLKFRGLLCNQCNNGLGNFRDNIEFLRMAIIYLEETS